MAKKDEKPKPKLDPNNSGLGSPRSENNGGKSSLSTRTGSPPKK